MSFKVEIAFIDDGIDGGVVTLVNPDGSRSKREYSHASYSWGQEVIEEAKAGQRISDLKPGRQRSVFKVWDGGPGVEFNQLDIGNGGECS